MIFSTFFRAAFVIISGLLTAQVIASAHVHSSNMALYEKIESFRSAGYVTVPGPAVSPRLKEWQTAVSGGLFFTMSVGVLLTLLSIAAAWMLRQAGSSRKGIFALLIILWAAAVLALNLGEFSPMLSLYFLFIPPLVVVAALKQLFIRPLNKLNPRMLYHVLTPLFLGILWFSQMNGSFFVDVRDYLLLSHKLGTKVNDFYYRYTLYPAEILKPLDRKLLKGVYYKHLEKGATERAIRKELLSQDYLPVEKETMADLTLTQTGNELRLEQAGSVILTTSPGQFLSSVNSWLGNFSSKTDGKSFFRSITFVSILTGLPMLIYLSMYGVFLLLLTAALPSARSPAPAVFLCLVSSMAVFLYFSMSRSTLHDENKINLALESGNWRLRVAALKFIRGNELEVRDYPAYRALLSSRHVPEKYWLAGALGTSRHPDTFTDLLYLLGDNNTTVVSAAFRALGNRKNPEAVRHILKRITAAEDWYNQWNAYNALKNLGWKQSPST